MVEAVVAVVAVGTVEAVAGERRLAMSQIVAIESVDLARQRSCFSAQS